MSIAPKIRSSVAALLGLCSLSGLFGCRMVVGHYMNVALTTGPNGRSTPSVPFDHVSIKSGDRLLDAFVVRAPANCTYAPVVLIYHGVKETISMWTKAQQFLYEHCVSSLVFDFPGSGDSSRPARFAAVGKDSVSVYEYTRSQFPNTRVYVLGHSMGNGPMLEAIPRFSQAPDGVIVASAFSSIRDFGKRAGGFYGFLAELSPDYWNNVKAVQAIKSPLLLIHSDSDKVNPLAEGRRIYDKAPQPKQITILHGSNHNDLYRKPALELWSPVLIFLSARSS